MALQTKKKWAQLRVGLLAVAALALLSFLIFLMTSSQGLFVSHSELYTFLNDSAAVAEGAPVRLNGITVGKVSRIGLSGSAQAGRIIRLTLDVDNHYLPSIPTDSQALIAAENLLGTKYINIKKGKAGDNVKAGAEIRSGETAELDDLFAQGATTIAAMQITLKRLDGIIAGIESGQGTFGKLLSDDTLYNKVVGVVDEGKKLIVTLNDDKSTLGKLLHDDALYNDVRGTISRVNALADDLQQGQGTAGKLLKDPALYDDMRSTIGDVRKLLAGLNEGKGTAGKLLNSDDLHNQLQATMGRLDAILDKVNSGQGTIGQLLVNPALYQTLDSTTREINGLMKDFRSNPKKFLRIKLAIF
jgi:phospholipid/cholesterol/gamma-HCH transport system substrate-binding protein